MDERVSDVEKLARTLAPLPGHVAELGDRAAGVETRLGIVESQIVQLRTEMADGFFAIRGELTVGLTGVQTGLRGEMAQMKTDLRAEMGDMKTELRAEMADMKTELREDIAALGRETAAGFLHVGGEMRGLHSKLDRLLESLAAGSGSRPRLPWLRQPTNAEGVSQKQPCSCTVSSGCGARYPKP